MENPKEVGDAFLIIQHANYRTIQDHERVSIFCIDQEVYYLQGPRGIDVNPYRITQLVGLGQYSRTNGGQQESKIVMHHNLRHIPDI